MVDRHYGTNTVTAGNSRKPMALSGCLYTKVGQAGVALANNTEIVMATIPIPDGAICSKGKGLRVRSYWNVGASGGNKTMRYRMGSVSGQILAAAVGTATDVPIILDMDLFLVDESTGQWESYGYSLFPTTVRDGSRQTDTDDIRNGWNLVVTQEAATAGDLIFRGVRVELITEGGVSA